MSAETRRLPDSNSTRLQALVAAKMKNDTMGVSSFLTTATQNRLNTNYANYVAKTGLVNTAKAELTAKTAEKQPLRVVLHRLASHFIQVFNLGVARGVFPASARAYYGLEVSSDVLPPMGTDMELITVANTLVSGDGARVLAGGGAMSMPGIAEVKDARDAYVVVYNAHSALADEYDLALEVVEALNAEADRAIKKVWDEVETYYNEEDPASQRENAREWGVVYVRKGSDKVVSGTVTSTAGGPLGGVQVKLEAGTNAAVSEADGTFSFHTTLMDAQPLVAVLVGYAPFNTVVTLVENENLTVNIAMEAIA